MILIADSGSTKTDWRLLGKDGQITQAKTQGFNPFYQDQETIEKELSEVLLPQLLGKPDEIHYYGAGISGERNQQILHSALLTTFPEAALIEVQNDLLASARALCGSEEGIACILGTGANCCVYNGEEIVSTVGGLGYVFGDEGSGASLGRQLLSEYLHHTLPKHLHEAFDKRYSTSRNEILENVYKRPMPNRYLAGFSKFLFHHKNDPHIYRMIYLSFTEFMEKNVLKCTNHQHYKVHFVGSIAFYYSDILRQVANDCHVALRNVLETPIAGLSLYHQEQAGISGRYL
ncbi:N-acetylglucosamine kinase [Roseivirga sp. BDSF3-8]|uniref:N-acetylglucosamine kinase n=1 Tax=Roseivirga sp. BDSF3-8 TaxID=3241598 RepID=UPI0035323DA2